MKFKKLFPLIVDTNIEVQTRDGETMLNGDPAAMTWDSIDLILQCPKSKIMPKIK